MSVALLVETEEEARRLLVAGSDLAQEDFRLKKLLPKIQALSPSAPVFARIAELMEKTLSSEKEGASALLLELSSLVGAVLQTQGQTHLEGRLEPLPKLAVPLTTTVPYRRIKPVIEALTSKGAGRLSTIVEAWNEGCFRDSRLIEPLALALDDSYPEISDTAAEILESIGPAVIHLLKDQLDIHGGKGHGRRVKLIASLSEHPDVDFFTGIVDSGSNEARLSAIRELRGLPNCEPILIGLVTERKKEVREAALSALAGFDTETAVNWISEAFHGKDRLLAMNAVKESRTEAISRMLLSEGEVILDELLKSEKPPGLFTKKPEPPSEELLLTAAQIFDCMEGKQTDEIAVFLGRCMTHIRHLKECPLQPAWCDQMNSLGELIAKNLFVLGSPEALKLLLSAEESGGGVTAWSFAAALLHDEPASVYNRFAKHIRKGRKAMEGHDVLSVLDMVTEFAEPYRLPEYRQSAHHRFKPMKDLQASPFSLDPRWCVALADAEETLLTSRLVNPKQPAAIRYLAGRFKGNLSYDNPELKITLLGLLQADYADSGKLVLEALEFNRKKGGALSSYYMNEFLKIARLLPPGAIPTLNAYIQNVEDPLATKLLEVIQYIKAKV